MKQITFASRPRLMAPTDLSRLVCASLISLITVAVLSATATGTDSDLGAPQYWPWLLTGLQVLALWSAGTRQWWGWLLGASVQPPWIAYAVLTGQFGFIPGCAISAAVQTYSFLHAKNANQREPNPRLGQSAVY